MCSIFRFQLYFCIKRKLYETAGLENHFNTVIVFVLWLFVYVCVCVNAHVHVCVRVDHPSQRLKPELAAINFDQTTRLDHPLHVAV